MSASKSGVEGTRQAANAIRTAIGAIGDDPARRAAVQARLSERPRTTPMRAEPDSASDLRTRFVAHARSSGATVTHVRSRDQIPNEVGSYLRENQVSMRLVHGECALVESLPWDDAVLIARRQGPATKFDMASLSLATAGIAETGTLFFVLGGVHQPVSHHYVPKYAIVMLCETDIVADYETAFSNIPRDPAGVPPRNINLITGPSRTADIEQKLVMGAHGPGFVHILLYRR